MSLALDLLRMSAKRVALFALLLASCEGDKDPVDSTAPTTGEDTGETETGDTGTTPPLPDTDSDALPDEDEIALGTDPSDPDTDDDSYRDGDEVTEGSDPLDPSSLIYTGGWPYYAGKDALSGGELPGSSGSALIAAEIGKRFARLQMVDQFGDTVDLFDFYNSDKPVVVDVSALWCAPCQELALWLDGESTTYSGIWPSGPDVVANGDVYWITVLGEGGDHLPATPEVPGQWFEVFPNPEIPVLADGDYIAADYVLLVGWPALVLLEPDLTVSVLDPYDSINLVLAELAARYP